MKSRAIVFCLAAAVLAAQVALFHGVRLDDAYITYRYAQNLATGGGFVFNHGDRLMGSTSPGEVLLSALVYLGFGHDATPGVMAAFGCVGWTVQGVALFYFLAPRVGTSRGALVALGLGAGAAGAAQWVPLETNIALAATLVGMTLGAQSRWVGAAVACAVAGLFRPDAYLGAALLAGVCLYENRTRAWKPAAVLIALSAPWPVFARLYFGSVLPQSAVIKYAHAGSLAYAGHILNDLPREVALHPAPLAGKVAFWALVLAGAVVAARSPRRLWLLPVYGALHAIAYVFLSPDPAFVWHLYPLAAVAVALGLLAIGTALERLRGTPRFALGAACVAAAALGTIDFARSYEHLPWFGGRDGIYQEISAYLAQRADPKDIVDAEEVGTIGYLTGLRMNDNARLVTRYPGDVFVRLERGLPTHLRWVIINGAQVQAEREGQHFYLHFCEGHAMVLFGHDGWTLAVVDLHDAPP